MFRTDVEFVMIMNLVYFSAVLTGCFDNHQKAEMLKFNLQFNCYVWPAPLMHHTQTRVRTRETLFCARGSACMDQDSGMGLGSVSFD